jgi:signal transduction histidine kinase
VISPENLLERLVELADHVQAVIQGLRAVGGEATPERTWGFDLVDRLRTFCRRFLADTGIECELALESERVSLGQQACEAVYWALCELLSNVRKHSYATRVTVSSGLLDGGFMYFRVADDGVGMPPGPLPTVVEGRGLGLWNVEQHLNALGGSVEIESTRGLCVTLLLPRP